MASYDVKQSAAALQRLPIRFVERFGDMSRIQSIRNGFRSVVRGLRRTSAGAGREEASAMVEFGMVVPVLSMFLVGIIYGGIMFYDDVVLANAVAVGARSAGTSRGDATVCTDAETALTNAAYGLQSSELTISGPTFTTASGAAGTSSCDVTTGSVNGVNCTAIAPCQSLNQGEFATFSATYPCSMYFPKLGINLCPVQGVGSKNPSATCTKSAYCITSTATALIE